MITLLILQTMRFCPRVARLGKQVGAWRLDLYGEGYPARLAKQRSGKDRILVPFRTWRNTMTESAARALGDFFEFRIPQHWSIAHLYHAVLRDELHVKDIEYLTTLSGYIHYQLTGQKVIGIGDASGMFPI